MSRDFLWRIFYILSLCLIHRCLAAGNKLILEPSVANLLSTANVPGETRGLVGDQQDIKANNIELVNFKLSPSANKKEDAIDTSDQSPVVSGSGCQLVPVMHILKHPGCQLKAISSYACSGGCLSYVQTSSSKLWQHERSCSCCQQTGSQEATFTLDCPSLDPPFRKVKTFAPVDCMCRACTSIGRDELRPQELVEALAGEVGSN